MPTCIRHLIRQVPEVLTSGYKWLRAVGQGEFTGVHTDKVFLGRGSPRVLTAWVPLGKVSSFYALTLCL